jgi:hypothetical protein
MTEEQIIKGKELLELISTTRSALEQISKLSSMTIPGNLSISEYSDGSGVKARLNRKRGNKELLSAIEAELAEQLSQYETEFAEL